MWRKQRNTIKLTMKNLFVLQVKKAMLMTKFQVPWQASAECLRVAKESFVKFPLTMKEQLLDEQLICFRQEKFADHPFPHKFLHENIQSVFNLHKHGKGNLIYFLVKSFRNRYDSKDTRPPIGAIPFG